ncbi:MAG TPA: hydrogenase maturation nickel metallochaperone HypA [Spirochaetales bacterium]|nr:hydrogenase maturation nickel metallochaperone HypA [Spirochaetales bacterium]HRY53192.1 hydrogenase maturation nickel metallochaperone HypA [Spirochaetia bacterium]HRZ64161.1 hydrogenase maturation nickel metallochaperone HypA [Spirochaetia bacterium]
MHELGVVMEVAKVVEDFARERGISKVEKLVLQIGELSAMIPAYVQDCWPCAVDGGSLEGTRLEIEVLPGNAVCGACGAVYRLLEHREGCPACAGTERELLSGREFLIKEILAC